MATMAKPKARAIPSWPTWSPPSTAAPQPNSTSTSVPTNSASIFFNMAFPRNQRRVPGVSGSLGATLGRAESRCREASGPVDPRGEAAVGGVVGVQVGRLWIFEAPRDGALHVVVQRQLGGDQHAGCVEGAQGDRPAAQH